MKAPGVVASDRRAASKLWDASRQTDRRSVHTRSYDRRRHTQDEPAPEGLPEANGPAEYLCAFFCWLRSLHREILKRPAVTLHTKKLREDS
jgi:hypothetical protein